MKKIIRIFKSKKGAGLPLAIFLMLFLITMFGCVSEFSRCSITVQKVRNNFQQAVTITATENYQTTSSSKKEGHVSSHSYVGDSFSEDKYIGSVYEKLKESLKISNNGSSYGNDIFKLYDLKISIDNPDINNLDEKKYKVRASITLELPLISSFNAIPLKINIKSDSNYIKIF